MKILLLLLVLAASPIAHGAPLKLPDIGDPSATVLGPEEERKLGQAFMRSVRRSLDVVEDVQIHTYINALGYRLLEALPDPSDTEFTFFVVDQPSINAFAGPGGYIGIHTGLILETRSEGELAAVLAHEIAHVTQRHLARAFQKASRANLQTAAAIIAAILLSSIDPQAAQAAIISASAGNIQRQLNFTRAHEKEADWLGIDILARAGYDPANMARFFQRLQEASRFNDSRAVPELLRTHPVTANRISDAQNRASRYGPVKASGAMPAYRYVQARLRARARFGDEEYVAELKRRADDEAQPLARYEYAQLLLELGRPAQAEPIATALLQAHPEQVEFISLQATVLTRLERFGQATALLDEALRLYPGHPWLTVLQAEALIEAGEPQRAIPLLRRLIEQQNHFALPRYHRLLARAQAEAGDTLGGYLSLAQYYYLIGQTHSAVTQLESALKQAGEEGYEKERIEARLEMFRQELKREQEWEKSR